WVGIEGQKLVHHFPRSPREVLPRQLLKPLRVGIVVFEVDSRPSQSPGVKVLVWQLQSPPALQVQQVPVAIQRRIEAMLEHVLRLWRRSLEREYLQRSPFRHQPPQDRHKPLS